MTDHPTRNLNKMGSAPPPPGDHPTQHLPALSHAAPRPCLRCGHAMISVDVLVPQNGTVAPLLYLGVKTDPGRFALRSHYALSPCFSLVYPRCGYTELYTINPKLWQESSRDRSSAGHKRRSNRLDHVEITG